MRRTDGWALASATPDNPALALAPMEGVSDAFARALLTEIGGIDLCVSEFVRVTDRALPRAVLLSHCPELRHGGRTPSGTPVLVQLLGSRPEALAESARVAVELGALGIDLNFGCPARRVNGHDGGAALLREPRRLETVIAAVRAAVPASLPVSAKVRLGWKDPDAIVSIARAAEAGGASFLTVHGRTKADMYRPPADWARIGRAARAVRLPVVANGDVVDPRSLAACRAETAAAAVMVGRGAFRVPNLFRWLRGLDDGPWAAERTVALLSRFASDVAAGPFRTPDRAALARTKQWCRYLGEADPQWSRCFDALKRADSLRSLLDLLHAHAWG